MTVIDESIRRVRAFSASNCVAPARLARLAGLGINSLRGMMGPTWNPTAETLRCLEAIIPADFLPPTNPTPAPTSPPPGFTVSIRFVPGRSIAADASFAPLPGESHERGRDLADGPWSEATLDSIHADLRWLLLEHGLEDQLRAEWGEEYAARIGVARGAVRALGLNAGALAVLERGLGSVDLLRLMARIGAMVGADFVGPEVTDSTPTPVATNPPPPPGAQP